MRYLATLLVAAVAAQAQEPLPIKSAKLSDKTYTLSGRHTLDKGIRLTLGKGVKVIGQGAGAVLNLDGGSLEVAGEPGAEVVFDNVWVNLGWKFPRLHIAHAKFLGKGGLFVPHEEMTRGKAVLEHVAFRGDTSIWTRFHEGGLELRDVTAQSTCQIAGTAPDRNVKLDISGCRFGTKEDPNVIQGGLRVHNVKAVTVVDTRVDGMNASFRGAVKLTIEGCRFDALGFYVRQDLKNRIGKTKIARCDFASKVIEFDAPKGGRDLVALTECHFVGDANTDPKDIVEKRIKATGARVVVKSPSATPHDLAVPDKPK